MKTFTTYIDNELNMDLHHTVRIILNVWRHSVNMWTCSECLKSPQHNKDYIKTVKTFTTYMDNVSILTYIKQQEKHFIHEDILFTECARSQQGLHLTYENIHNIYGKCINVKKYES